jgi:hypothetical protein
VVVLEIVQGTEEIVAAVDIAHTEAIAIARARGARQARGNRETAAVHALGSAAARWPTGSAGACAVRAGRSSGAAGIAAALAADTAAASLPRAAGVIAGAAMVRVGLEIGACIAAAGQSSAAGAAGKVASAAIGHAAALAGLADRLGRAAVAFVADLVAVAGVIASPAILRIGLAVGANIPAAGQILGATDARGLTAELRGAARRSAANLPIQAAHRVTAGPLARTALGFAAVTSAWTTVSLAADLARSARGPALPAVRWGGGSGRGRGGGGSARAGGASGGSRGRGGRWGRGGHADPVLALLPDLIAGTADVVGPADLAKQSTVGHGAAPAGVAHSVALPGAGRASCGADVGRTDIGAAAVAANGAGRADPAAGSRFTSSGPARLARSAALSADGAENLCRWATQLLPITDAIAATAVAALRLAIGTAVGAAFGVSGWAAAACLTGNLNARAGGSRRGGWGRRGRGRLRWQGGQGARRRRPRLSTPGSLGLPQNGAGGGYAAQSEQTLQQGSPRAPLAKGTNQGIEPTIVHEECSLRSLVSRSKSACIHELRYRQNSESDGVPQSKLRGVVLSTSQ